MPQFSPQAKINEVTIHVSLSGEVSVAVKFQETQMLTNSSSETEENSLSQ